MTHDELSKCYQLIATHNTLSLSNTSLLYPDRHTSSALPVLVIDHPLFDAQILLQGAQLIQFTPKNDTPWLWLSPLADFKKNSPTRGGIPVCFPWFGVNKEDASKPKHGFVRQEAWQLHAIANIGNALQITLRFSYRANTPDLYPYPFDAEIIFTLSDKLQIDFNFTNLSDKTLTYSYALHSYFVTFNLPSTKVEGLDGVTYIDSADANKKKVQEGDIFFTQEVDRIFPEAPETQIAHTLNKLAISSKTCRSCIIWNPHQALANTMKDTLNHYKRFVCIERGCTEDQSVQLDAKSTHNSRVFIKKT